jgi:hypothetical protein
MNAKKILYFLGKKTSPRIHRKLISAAGSLDLGAWLHSQSWEGTTEFQSRRELFALAADQLEDEPTLYLEFGVFKADATRVWAELLKHPETVFHGFDTFEGLPESWGNEPKGNYSTYGSIPEVNDSRVQFYKGLFSDSLPLYTPPQKRGLILNFDADLYSSTIYALRHFREIIVPGTWIYFDEFNSIGHEERAYRDFVGETGYIFKCHGHVNNFSQVMLQRVS